MKKIVCSWATLMILTLFVSLTSALFFTFEAQAALPTAKIKVRAVSPRNMAADTTLKRTSTGLPNVAVGSLVYLVGGGGLTDTVTTYAWTLTPPTGSSATLSNAAIQNPTFLADVAGQYLVGLVITDNKGQVSAQTTLWINAGTYVGVGNIGGTTATYPQCAYVCHPQQESKWHHTRHAEIFRDGIDGKLPSIYRSTCISCHTTGYDTNPAAVNGGFDDVAQTVGWVFPATLMQGNWDTLVTKYPKLAQLAVIGCESCHGPGSAHGALHDKNQIHATYDNGPCATCHDSGTRHFRPYQWDTSGHGNSELAEAENRSSCSRCHTAQGFVEETIRGNPSAAPYPDPKPITCAACHDPHIPSTEAPAQLRRGSVAEACTGCHVLRISSRGLHHSHQTDMFEGKNGMEYPGQVYLNSTHSEIEDKCAVCHMARTSEEPITAADSLVGGHTFKAYNDRGTPDIGDDVVNTYGCIDCHGEVTPTFIELSQESIKTLLEELKALLPIDPATKEPFAHVRLDPANYTKAEIAGAYNYYFVLYDGSYGVHNHKYAEKLLRDAIKEIKATKGAGNIVDIFDVPNDQGKQVHILWNAFPAEQSAINPIINYGVWRRFNGNLAGNSVMPVSSFKEMLTRINTAANAQSRFVVAGSQIWDFVGLVPAAGHDRYGYVAPTIFDSTKVAGMHWSAFYVSGHTSDPAIVYESLPDSGYSVDNLAPLAPSNTVASLLPNKTVSLRWADPVDEDFQYFAIYRSTTAGFDPKSTKPLATLTGVNYNDTDVTPGSRYYYRLSAYDFAGNESQYSPELSVLITSVAERGGGVPTEYALEQNYPNPFNPETTIKYQLPASSRVRLSIYTALGQEIRLLVDYTQPAAYHQIVWDGRDNAGNPLPSGLYFYRLETDKFTAIKKMVLMK